MKASEKWKYTCKMFNVGTRRKWVVDSTPPPPYTSGGGGIAVLAGSVVSLDATEKRKMSCPTEKRTRLLG
jgi:hypothetical protein